MRCACRGEVSKSARLKWSPTVARRDFLTLAQRFRDNMKGNFQFVFHANSASPNFDRSDSIVALEEWQFAVGGQKFPPIMRSCTGTVTRFSTPCSHNVPSIFSSVTPSFCVTERTPEEVNWICGYLAASSTLSPSMVD